MTKNIATACLAWVTLGLASPSALADTRALLVGVSEYPSLAGNYQLHGPRNDVQRMKRVLEQRGIAAEQVTVLADGVRGADAPTRSNILQALATLASQAKAGDTVLLFFAGHGSQQPADPKSPQGRAEPDGLHEIFLPADVGPWDNKIGSVKNAIVNYELRAAVDRIQDRGAFVWGVFDACHSASLVRGGGDGETRYRYIAPEDLGIPKTVLAAAEAAAPRTRGGKAPEIQSPLGAAPSPQKPGRGQGVFFYAAQTTERTPELRLPLDDPNRQVHGLFSHMLLRALEMGQAMSYRQLGQYVLAQYGSIGEANVVTPMFTGPALDDAVLGQQALPVRQWPIDPATQSLPAGSLAGIGDGAVFALMAGPLAKTEEALGYFKAGQVQGTSTSLVPVQREGKAAPGMDKLPPGAYARLIANPESYALKLALDSKGCQASCPWTALIERLKQEGVPGADLRWVNSGAELILKLSPQHIRAVAPAGASEGKCEGRQPCTEPGFSIAEAPSINDEAAALREIRAALHAMARSRNLLRLASTMVVQSRNPGLVITLAHRAAKGKASRSITPESVPILLPGDSLAVTVSNNGQKPVDITLLYADARFGITPLFPKEGEPNRLAPGDVRLIEGIDISDEAGVFGIERLLVISAEAQKHGERADFSFLSQPALAERAARTRGAASNDDMQAFLDAGFADYATRGGERTMPGSRVGMQVFTFDVKPRRAGQARP